MWVNFLLEESECGNQKLSTDVKSKSLKPLDHVSSDDDIDMKSIRSDSFSTVSIGSNSNTPVSRFDEISESRSNNYTSAFNLSPPSPKVTWLIRDITASTFFCLLSGNYLDFYYPYHYVPCIIDHSIMLYIITFHGCIAAVSVKSKTQNIQSLLFLLFLLCIYSTYNLHDFVNNFYNFE